MNIISIFNCQDLDKIAWYIGNSAVDYSGAYDVSNWPDKQINYKMAGTHRVGLKEPNKYSL